jgi:hypothetical protein
VCVLLLIFCVLYFCIVLCIFSPRVYICLFFICVQIYRPLPPGGNQTAVNKYHIIVSCQSYFAVQQVVFQSYGRLSSVDCSVGNTLLRNMGKYLSSVTEGSNLHQHQSQKLTSPVRNNEFCRLHLNIDGNVNWFLERGQEITFFSFSKMFTLAVASTQPPIRWVPCAFSPGEYERERKTWPLNLRSTSVTSKWNCILLSHKPSCHEQGQFCA